MALQVPKQQASFIKALLELPDEKIEALLVAISKVGPQFNVYDLSGEISKFAQLAQPLTFGIMQVVASLYLTRDQEHQPKSTEQFVDNQVFSALKSAQTFSDEKIDAQWNKIRRFLLAALKSERTVGTTVKAGRILTQHERIFCGARILSDLRPIYHFEVNEKPDAAVVIHMLKITQRDNSGHRNDIYFAMDSNDLVQMRETIERAMAKETTLKNLLKDSGVVVLDPKETY